MSALALLAALGASFTWAVGGLLAHGPARLLGSFAFTHIQLVSAGLLLVLAVTLTGGWASVAWGYWPNFAVSSLVGVVMSNLAMVMCLRQGGPRRTLLLVAMSAPIAALLGFFFLSETLSPGALAGAGLALFGVALAILYGAGRTDASDPAHAPLASIIATGLIAAACHATGLIALKPALIAGTEPLAASALRIAGGAGIVMLVALWPAKILRPASPLSISLVLRTILPGLLGYGLAATLLLYALRSHNTGVVAVLGSAAPVMVLPILWIITRRPPPLPAWLGAGCVVAGTGIILMG